MTRHTLCWMAVAGLALLLGSPTYAEEAPNIVGNYKCEGTNPDGQVYKGTVQIKKDGDAYAVTWAIGQGDNYKGIGILEGNVLAVSYYGGITGVVVYRVEKGGKLVGKWALVGG